MNGYNLTDRTRKVLAITREEAAKLGHDYISTQHILLGIITEGSGKPRPYSGRWASP